MATGISETPTTEAGRDFRQFLASLMEQMAPEEPNEYDERFDAAILAIEAEAVASLKGEVRDADAEIRALRADLAAAYKFIRRRLGHYALKPVGLHVVAHDERKATS